MQHSGTAAAVPLLLLGLVCWSSSNAHADPSASADIAHYRPVFEQCQAAARRTLAIRAYSKDGVEYRLTVDPQNLQTRLEPAATLQCNSVPERIAALLTGSPYWRALNAERLHENLVQDAGLTRALQPVNGYFLTADLCPSSKPGFNEELFEVLERARAVHHSVAVPLALSISGGWLKKHAEAFAWLRGEEAAGRLRITWVNHTSTHPYDKQLDVSHNFLREVGIDALAEVLELEKMLVEQDVAPSVFFRFPGLVSSPELIEMLESLHLVAVGSDAWLAKGERPTPGGVILIHANLNEPAGVELLLKWVASQQQGSITFLPLEAVSGAGT